MKRTCLENLQTDLRFDLQLKNAGIRSIVNSQGKVGCPQLGSTEDNWKKMNKNSDSVQNISKLNLLELKNAIMIPQTRVQWPVTQEEYQKILDAFLEDYKEKHCSASFCHARSLINFMNSDLQHNGKTLRKITDMEFISRVLEHISATASFARRRTILKAFFELYFIKYGYSKLDPERIRVINLITGYKSIERTTRKKSIEHHKYVEKFLHYLTEKGFKWQRRASIDLTVFMKWLVVTENFSGQDYKEINIRRITSEMLSGFRDYLLMRVELKQLSINTAQKYIQTLRRWFSFLKQRNYISSNPCNCIDNFRVNRRKEFRLLTLVEVERFFDEILKDNEPLKWLSVFMTIAALGIRSVELLRLKRSNIDFEMGTIKILRKGGHEQTLPVPGLVILLLELHLKSTFTEDSELIWRTSLGQPLTYRVLNKKFHKFMNGAGIDEKVGAVHFFRHLLISELCSQSWDLDKIKILAGDSSIRHLDPYIHTRNSDVKHHVKTKLHTIGSDIYDRISN